ADAPPGPRLPPEDVAIFVRASEDRSLRRKRQRRDHKPLAAEGAQPGTGARVPELNLPRGVARGEHVTAGGESQALHPHPQRNAPLANDPPVLSRLGRWARDGDLRPAGRQGGEFRTAAQLVLLPTHYPGGDAVGVPAFDQAPTTA